MLKSVLKLRNLSTSYGWLIFFLTWTNVVESYQARIAGEWQKLSKMWTEHSPMRGIDAQSVTARWPRKFCSFL